MLNFSRFSSLRTANLLRFGDGLRHSGRDSETCSLWSWTLDGDRSHNSWSASFRESKNWTLLGDMYSFLNFLTGLFGRSSSESPEDRRLFLGDDGEDEFSSFSSWYSLDNSLSDLTFLSSSEKKPPKLFIKVLIVMFVKYFASHYNFCNLKLPAGGLFTWKVFFTMTSFPCKLGLGIFCTSLSSVLGRVR